MNWIQKLLSELGAWWRNRRPYRLAFVEDQPDELRFGTLYLVGEPDAPWSAAMACPCGCGAEIRLSLIPTDKPRWRITRFDDGSFTLHPSIWRTKDCRAHFLLRRSRIVWAGQ